MPSFPLLPSVQVLFSPFREKPGLAFRDHHGLAQTRKLCLRFLCYLLFKSSFLPSVRNQDCLPGSPLGTHKLANYAFVSFASFCSSPLFSFCEKPRPWITRGLLSDSQTCLKCRFVSLANYLRLPLASLLARATHSREDQVS
jgi:hypothetical protein